MTKTAGMTVIELIVVLFISSIVIIALVRFISIGFPVSKITYLQTQSNEAARIHMRRLTKAIREARSADSGAYALEEALPQRIIFYSNIDNDTAVERVRYELDGTDLERGITNPTGTPPAYDSDDEEVAVVARSVRNDTEPIFTYYSGDYPTDTTALDPTDLTEVKYIEIELILDVDPAADPPATTVSTQVQIRNLKTNLGTN